MKTALRILSNLYFLLISVYCFAGVNSYTYLFLVKNPPYPWLAWFVDQAQYIYWAAVAAVVPLLWTRKTNPVVVGAFAMQCIVGVLFCWQRLPGALPSGWPAYVWSLAVLLPMLLLNACELFLLPPPVTNVSSSSLSCWHALLVGAVLGVASVAGVLIRTLLNSKHLTVQSRDFQLVAFVLGAHLWLALIVTTLLNSLDLIAEMIVKTRNSVRFWGVFVLGSLTVDLSVIRFLRNTLSFSGWPIHVYAALLACFIGCNGSLFYLSLKQDGFTRPLHLEGSKRSVVLIAIGIFLVMTAALLPVLFDDSDWNGLTVNTLTLLLWVLFGSFVYTVLPQRKGYSAAGLTAVVLVSGSLFWGLESSGFLWASQLGQTQQEVSASLKAYESQNASFRLIEGIFDVRSDESCGDYCRTLRQYTNIRNAKAKVKLQLVDNLVPTTAVRPNIFIFVIDSLRADYVGAFNPKVDFTPNLDALARDSIVMRKAFTQYAGTSLSEPAIWSGALLLHAHYMRPFDNVNSLKMLAKTDGYQIAVSYDHILRNILRDSEDVIKFDSDKRFNEMEISSTLQQLTTYLDTRPNKTQPVLFYAQPMNIHVLGVNHLPEKSNANWRNRSGFIDRIAFKVHQVDDSLGSFVHYLKARGLYDNSIIIVTADHGDAIADLPGFGLVRREHSLILFPEVMRVPLIFHLPASMRKELVYDEDRIACLTDITPTLYYVLGHGPIHSGSVYGQSVVASSAAELHRHTRDHLLLASDARAAYGVLTGDARFMYVTYDSPQLSLLFDLQADPKGTHDILTPRLKTQCDDQIVEDLRSIAAFYDFRPSGGSSGDFSWDQEQ